MSTLSKSTSCTTPAVSVGLSLPPPPIIANPQKRNVDATRKTTTTSGYTNPGSGISQVPPITMSNSDILSMFNRLEQRMNQQNETNKKFLEQIEKISSETRRPIETTPVVSSVLRPRILNF